MPDITREELRNTLREWQAGSLEPQQVLEWAEERYDLEILKDEVVIEILTCLDSLHQNLITVEDVPVFLQMLDAPLGREQDALMLLAKHDESVDWKARKDKYKNHPLYGIFCKE